MNGKMSPATSAAMLALLLLVSQAPAFGGVTPIPPYAGAVESISYKVTVDGQPVFVHRHPTYNQFQWMDFARFTMTGKVRVTVETLVSQRDVVTCNIRPLAYGIKPVIKGNAATFELDRPRYLVIFLNEEPRFQNTGLLLFAEPPEKNAPKLGDPGVINIMDYKVDNTGGTVETEKINKAIGDVSARPGGGTLYFPPGAYKTGTVVMQSNVTFYVAAGAVIRGTRKQADYVAVTGVRNRAQFLFNNVQNASLKGRGAIDIEGYPWLWHDAHPDTGEGASRSPEGLVRDPGGNGIKGYIVYNSRNVTFEDLVLLRSAYWTVTVTNTDGFTSRNIKIVSRKNQYHDDAYDFTGNSKHILVENGFSMTTDDTFAFYRSGGNEGLEDVVVKGFVNYGFTAGLILGYGQVPKVTHLRLEDVHFVTTQNKFAFMVQATPAYTAGRGTSSGPQPGRGQLPPQGLRGAGPNRGAPSTIVGLDDFRVVNSSFESDGGHIYIDGGDVPLTNFFFENCTFYKADRPGKLTGNKVSPIVFKNLKMNGAVVKSLDQFKRAGYEVSVPIKFE